MRLLRLLTPFGSLHPATPLSTEMKSCFQIELRNSIFLGRSPIRHVTCEAFRTIGPKLRRNKLRVRFLDGVWQQCS